MAEALLIALMSSISSSCGSSVCSSEESWDRGTCVCAAPYGGMLCAEVTIPAEATRPASAVLHANRPVLCLAQGLRAEKDEVEARIGELAEGIAQDLGLILDKTIKLEWHKAANTRTRCLRITQVRGFAGAQPPGLRFGAFPGVSLPHHLSSLHALVALQMPVVSYGNRPFRLYR